MLCLKPIEINDLLLYSSSAPEPKPAASAWVSGHAYAKGDEASNAYHDWLCIAPVTSSTPPGEDLGHWLDLGAYERVWVSGATYALFDEAILTNTHRKYMRIVPGAGTIPPSSDKLNWKDIGPTNRYAMFDTLRNTKTSHTGTLTVVIKPGQRVRALALMGTVATSVTVSVVAGGITRYTTTRNMTYRDTKTWTDYFFGGFKNRPALLLTDLPPYSSAEITITLVNNQNADVQCGAVCLGTPVDVGRAQYNAVSRADNYSEVSRDTFGNATLIPRRSVPKTDQITRIDKSQVNALYDLRTDVNAVPCVWSALDDRSTDGYFNAFLILGIYKEFTINADFTKKAQVTLQIEEV